MAKFDTENDREDDDIEYDREDDDIIHGEESLTQMDGVNFFLNNTRKYPVLNRADELELLIATQNGDELSREKLILSNAKLVSSIARKFIKRARTLELIDLIQEGNLGLMHAINLYDTTSGNKLSTYATPWIRKYIREAILTKESFITTSSKKVMEENKICYIRDEFIRTNNGKSPSVEYLGKTSGMSYKLFKNALMRVCTKVGSLDAVVASDAKIIDTIPNTRSPNPEELLQEKQIKARVHAIFTEAGLSSDECQTLKRYFGFNDDELQESTIAIGKSMGCSGERVRQINIGAMKKAKQYLYKNHVT